MTKFLTFLSFVWCSLAVPCFAEYTSIISASDFDGPKADVNTVVLGMIGIFIIVFAGSLIIRHLRG